MLKKLLKRDAKEAESEAEAKAKAEAEAKAKAEAEAAAKAKAEAEIKAEAEAKAITEAKAKRTEALYSEMRSAVLNKEYLEMMFIIGSRDYNPNRVGAGDKRTALHTAAHEDDWQALDILLGQKNIDTNVKTTDGLTPFLLAAAEGKKVAFEVLLGDDRVDKNARNEKDQSALELINALSKKVRVKKAMKHLAKQGKMTPSNKNTTKLAVIIGNSEYQANSGDSVSWDDLPGAKEDVVAMKTRLTDDGYQVEVIENSSDFLTDVEDLMYKIPVASVTYLQVL